MGRPKPVIEPTSRERIAPLSGLLCGFRQTAGMPYCDSQDLRARLEKCYTDFADLLIADELTSLRESVEKCAVSGVAITALMQTGDKANKLFLSRQAKGV